MIRQQCTGKRVLLYGCGTQYTDAETMCMMQVPRFCRKRCNVVRPVGRFVPSQVSAAQAGIGDISIVPGVTPGYAPWLCPTEDSSEGVRTIDSQSFCLSHMIVQDSLLADMIV